MRILCLSFTHPYDNTSIPSLALELIESFSYPISLKDGMFPPESFQNGKSEISCKARIF
jgi:hypothetical protein